MRIVQILAMAANIVFIGFVVFAWATSPSTHNKYDYFGLAIFVLFPVLNITALIGLLRRSKPSIIELYFAVRRANLEKQLAASKA